MRVAREGVEVSRLYPTVQPEEEVAIPWRTEDYLIACCDCNLVHRFTFRVDGEVLYLSAVRENRRTAALRRHRGSGALRRDAS